MELFLFICFSIICIISALFVVLLKNPVKSALSLIITFFSMGGLYLLLEAEFIALMQILVYAGAVMVLFLFVIMLLDVKGPLKEEVYYKNRKVFTIPLVVLFFVLLLVGFFSPLASLGEKGKYSSEWILSQGGNVKVLAEVLFQKYLLPFEITSVLLLVAAVGIMVLGKKRVK